MHLALYIRLAFLSMDFTEMHFVLSLDDN